MLVKRFLNTDNIHQYKKIPIISSDLASERNIALYSQVFITDKAVHSIIIENFLSHLKLQTRMGN